MLFMRVIYRNLWGHGGLCGSSIGIRTQGCPGGLGLPPVRSIHGSGVALWIMGTSAVPGTQGSQWLWVQEIWLYKESFLASAAGTQGSLRLVFLYFLTHQALKSLPSLGSSSIDQLPITGMWGGRGYNGGFIPHCDSAVALYLHGHLGFLKMHSPLQISTLPSPRALCPHQQQSSPRDFFPVHMLQLPVTMPTS